MKRLSSVARALTAHRVAAALGTASCAAACLALTGAATTSATTLPIPVAAVLSHSSGRLAPGRLGDTGQPGSGLAAGSVALDGSPAVLATNARTDTGYVPIQCATGSCATPSHVVDIINTATCNAKISSGCRVVARAQVGTSPLAAVIDKRTDTVYVVNGGSNTVSVLNGARCNARVTAGCDHPVATIKVGTFPVAAVFNPATRTLYVASPNGNVFVLNTARCNAVTARGCGQPVKTVKITPGPQALDVDVATDTIYTANSGISGNGNTVSVINGATCNGHTGSGCAQAPPTVKVGSGAWWVAVDQASDTVYVANNNDGTVSVINGATCNATITSGCGGTPPTVSTGAAPQFVAVDPGRHTLFVVNNGDDTLSAINTQTCNGTVTSGCQKIPPSLRAAPDRALGYNPFPNALALLPRTGTAYVLTVGGRNVLSVTSISRCNASNTTGCRRLAPSVPEGAFLASVDPATGTIYASSLTMPQIDVLNGATCNARDLAGCAPVAEIPMPHPQASVGAIDNSAHTLYASDESPSGTVAVIDTAACNATNTSGCAQPPLMINIGAFPGQPVINPATHTMYVSYGSNASKVAVINATTCNATDTSGCGQPPAVVRVGQGTNVLAVSVRTDTIYAPNTGLNGFNGDTVSVINGATCNGTNHTGCGHLAATVKVGLGPFGAAVNDRTQTVYVGNNADGDSPGTVSVINGATCNGTVTTGCHRRLPTMATGNSPLGVAVDTRTGILYVADFSSASVTVLNGSRCNAAVTSGCGATGHEQAVGSQPFGLAINPGTQTVYVTNLFQAGSMSILTAAG